MTTRDGAVPLEDAGNRLQDEAEQAGLSIAGWLNGTNDAAARRAGGEAVEALDRMASIIHQARAKLVDELRAADDRAGEHADELLARLAAEDFGPGPGPVEGKDRTG